MQAETWYSTNKIIDKVAEQLQEVQIKHLDATNKINDHTQKAQRAIQLIDKHKNALNKSKEALTKQHTIRQRYNEDIVKLRKAQNEEEKVLRETLYFDVYKWIKNNDVDYLPSFENAMTYENIYLYRWIKAAIAETKRKWLRPQHIEVIMDGFGYPLFEYIDNFIPLKQIDFYPLNVDYHKRVFAQCYNKFEPEYKIVMFNDFAERKESRRRDVVINTDAANYNPIPNMIQYYKKEYSPPLIVNIYKDDFTKYKSYVNQSGLINILYIEQKEIENTQYTLLIGTW